MRYESMSFCSVHTHIQSDFRCVSYLLAAAVARDSSLQPPPALALLCLYVLWMVFTST